MTNRQDKNPYSTPEAFLSEEIKPRRTIFIWIIFLYHLLSLIFVLPILFVALGLMEPEKSSIEFYEKLSVFDYLFTLFGPVLSFLAALYLLRLRKLAFKLWVGYGIYYLISLTYLFNSDSMRDSIESQAIPIQYLIGFNSILICTIIVYAYYVQKQIPPGS